MKKINQDLQFLNEIQSDQKDLAKIIEQRQIVSRLQSSFQKKDDEITQLKSLLEKYQQYQQKYTSLKVELAEKTHLIVKKQGECKLLRKQNDQLIREQEEGNSKIKQYEFERQSMIRERHTLQKANKQIELTFKEYQSQCRKRENTLNHDLERAYQQIKDSNIKIDQLEFIAQQKISLQIKLKQLESQRYNQNKKTSSSKQQTAMNEALNEDIELFKGEIAILKEQLLKKQQQLSIHRVLNYELTIEYDSSVNTICALESQLSRYRKENNEVRKIVSLMRQQNRCQQIEQKYTLRNASGKQTHCITPVSDEANSYSSQQEYSDNGDYNQDKQGFVSAQS